MAQDRTSAAAVFAAAFGCSADTADALIAKARLKSYAPRATIIESQHRNAHVYLLLDGRAHALALSVDGRLVLVESFDQGAIFGEASLLGDGVADHEVAALDRVEAGQFANHVFIAMMENYSCIALTMSRLLTARLLAASRQMVEIATLSAPGRVHGELLRQARLSGDWTISPPPVLAEFAVRIRSTRETVSRTISSLEKNGIIRRDERALTVVAPHRLEDLIY